MEKKCRQHFPETMQTISTVPTIWKVLFSILYWIIALGFFFATMARNMEIPESLSRYA